MLRITAKIANIDYSAVTEKTLPLLVDSMAKKKENGKLGKLLPAVKHMGVKSVVAALAVLPQEAKDEIAVLLIKNYDHIIKKYANSFLQSKNLPLEVHAIAVKKNDFIELSLEFNDFDYASLVFSAYPAVATKFSGDQRGKFFTILSMLGDHTESMIQTILATLSQEEKDALVENIISVYEPEIIMAVRQALEQHELKLSFIGVRVERR